MSDTKKIDGSALVIYEMVIAGSSLQDNWEREVVLGISFLIFSDADTRFVEEACLKELHNCRRLVRH